MACRSYLLGFGEIVSANTPAGAFPKFYLCDAEIDLPTSNTGAGSMAYCIAEGTNWRALTLNAWTKVAAGAVVGSPNVLSISLGNAFQATDPTKAALVTINMNSVASLSISGGTTITGEVRIGASSTGLGAGTSGTAVGAYKNSLTGTIVVGVAMNSESYNAVTIALPAGWFFAVRATAGTLVIVSAFDQSIN